MVFLGCFESGVHEIDVGLGRLLAFNGFLLEAVQYINEILEADGIDGSVGVSIMAFDNLRHTGP